MEWLNRMQDALNMIEDRITSEVSIEEIARTAYSSPFHFQRMFHMVTGVTVAEYIRKRKLTLAAQELAISDIKVLDVALKYGYDSPESFAKAFRKTHGIAPSAARAPGVRLKAYPRLSFQISLKGDQDMDYKIVDQKAFQVVGKALKVSTQNGENLERIPKFWTECCQDGTCAKLCGIAPGQALLGICSCVEQEKEVFTYMVAVEGESGSKADGFETLEIPAATWAIFNSIGPMPGAIQEVWKRIFQEWFPATGYEHAVGPELEVYPPGDNLADDYRCEVWIPIVKK